MILEKIVNGISGIGKEPSGGEKFRKVTEEMARLYERKNADYGGEGKSVGEQMYDRYGDMYYVTMIIQKALRIESLSKADKTNFESIEDSYRDIANYAVMAMLSHKEERGERW